MVRRSDGSSCGHYEQVNAEAQWLLRGLTGPVGDTSTYAIPAKSWDTGVTRRSVDNPGLAS